MMMDVLHMHSVGEQSGLNHANSTDTLQGVTCQKKQMQLLSTSSHILCLCKAVNKDMSIFSSSILSSVLFTN